MSIKTILQKAATTAFRVFASLVTSVSYLEISDDGFGTVTTVTHTGVPVLILSTAEVDVSKLTFSDRINPTDKLCLLQGVTVAAEGITVHRNHKITIGSVNWTIIDFDVDAAEALYTCLLRKV